MSNKVRYAIVGLGDISQEGMLPGIDATGNSEVTAFVTSDARKAHDLGKRYGVTQTYAYDDFETLLRSGTIDAVYVATPNWRHAEFVVPALRAGIHVLVEKPLEVDSAKCREILDAAASSSAKLMVAYRLHFEPGTLDLLQTVASGELGDVRLFTSAFAQVVSADNHRAANGDFAGPVLDMAPYPINAARYVFGAEPTAVVSAIATRHPGSGFEDLDDTVAVTLAFPGERLAQFVVSYYGAAIDTYSVIGTKGSVVMSPGYLYGVSLASEKKVGEKKRRETYENTDHFGGELKYFSACILEDRAPEPDAEEGFADVRVIDGIFEALRSGQSVELPPFERSRRIDPSAQLETLRAHNVPNLVNASNPGRNKTKSPLN